MNNLKNILPDTKKRLKGFVYDFKRLFKASRGTAILLIVVELFLGLVVILEIGVVVNLIDSLIGGRALRIVTSDISTAVNYQIILFIALVPALIAHHQFTGIAGKIGTGIRRLAFIASMILISLPIAPFFLILVGVGAYVIEYFNKRWVHWLFSIVIIGVAAIKFSKVIDAAVYSGVTVGQALYFGSSLLILTAFFALRPYLSPEK